MIREEVLVSPEGTKHTEETKKTIGEGVSKTGALRDYTRNETYLVQKPDGTMTVVKNMSKWCKPRGLCKSNMRRVARGITSHHKFYKASFYNEE